MNNLFEFIRGTHDLFLGRFNLITSKWLDMYKAGEVRRKVQENVPSKLSITNCFKRFRFRNREI